jgi:Leucine-rich repeat (LRR) protein
LGGNRFEGTIPPSIFTPALQHFDVGDNKLIGTIPEELYTVSQDMLNIDMSQNSLSGTIPVGLGSFPTLNSLTIFNNTFSGTLPGQIVSDTLKTLDVGRNMLTGTLPDEVYMFGSSLTFINFGVNLFAGTISPRFGDLTKLQTLVFYFTDVTGTIPFELSRLTNLEILHFAGTLLQGIMPAEICSLREGSLQVLTANCFGQVPVVNCSCCTYCYREGDDAGRLIG